MGLILVIAASAPAESQTRDVAFLHGYPGSSTAFDGYRSQLGQEFDIRTRAPGWSQYFANGIPYAANQTCGQLAPNSVVVAHSAGGVLSRELRRGGCGKVAGLVTFGSPHRGAPISDLGPSAVNMMLDDWIQDLTRPWLFWGYGSSQPEIEAWASGALGVVATGLNQFVLDGTFNSATARDLRPGSPVINQLAAAPSAAFPAAHYTIYGDEDWWTHVRLAGSKLTGQPESDAVLVAYAGLFFAYDFFAAIHFYNFVRFTYAYYDTGDPFYAFIAAEHFYLSALFGYTAYQLGWGWQNEWSEGAVGTQVFYDDPGEDDGFIPISSQAPYYVDFSRRIRAEGSNHAEQTSTASTAFLSVRDALRRQDINLPLPGSNPDPEEPEPGPGPDPDPCYKPWLCPDY